MTLFSDGLSAGFDSIEDVAGQEVTYSYDGQEITVTAVLGQNQAQETNMGGRMLVTNRDADFLIRPSELKIGGNPVEPKRGNVITLADGTVFKVAAGAGGPCWRYSDSNKTFYRIQTVRA